MKWSKVHFRLVAKTGLARKGRGDGTCWGGREGAGFVTQRPPHPLHSLIKARYILSCRYCHLTSFIMIISINIRYYTRCTRPHVNYVQRINKYNLCRNVILSEPLLNHIIYTTVFRKNIFTEVLRHKSKFLGVRYQFWAIFIICTWRNTQFHPTFNHLEITLNKKLKLWTFKFAWSLFTKHVLFFKQGILSVKWTFKSNDTTQNQVCHNFQHINSPLTSKRPKPSKYLNSQVGHVVPQKIIKIPIHFSIRIFFVRLLV